MKSSVGKLKTSAEFSDLPLKNSKVQLKIRNFAHAQKSSATSADFQRKGRNAADHSQKAPEKRDFSRAFDRRPAAEKILLKFDISSDSFVPAPDKSRISQQFSNASTAFVGSCRIRHIQRFSCARSQTKAGFR
jgi:hypothetical protein